MLIIAYMECRAYKWRLYHYDQHPAIINSTSYKSLSIIKRERTQKHINILGELETIEAVFIGKRKLITEKNTTKLQNNIMNKSMQSNANKCSAFQLNHDETGETHDDNLNRRGKRAFSAMKELIYNVL